MDVYLPSEEGDLQTLWSLIAEIAVREGLGLVCIESGKVGANTWI
jgi:hypothetical protein